jgi:hypothetical protein
LLYWREGIFQLFALVVDLGELVVRGEVNLMTEEAVFLEGEDLCGARLS